MKYTENYNLKKPEQSDSYDIDDFNENSETLDKELARLAKLLKVEDISSEFIVNHSSNAQLQISTAEVYKQGNVVSGTLLIQGELESASGAYEVFEINSKYKPIQPNFVCQGAMINSWGDYIKSGVPVAVICNGILSVGTTMPGVNVLKTEVSFSYICG